MFLYTVGFRHTLKWITKKSIHLTYIYIKSRSLELQKSLYFLFWQLFTSAEFLDIWTLIFLLTKWTESWNVIRKGFEISTMEERLRTMTEFAETPKLTVWRGKRQRPHLSVTGKLYRLSAENWKKINFWFIGLIIRNNRMWKEWNHNIILERRDKI